MSGPEGVAGDRLRSFVERIERIDEDLKAMNDEKKGVFAEAKGEGFSVKILKEVIRLSCRQHGSSGFQRRGSPTTLASSSPGSAKTIAAISSRTPRQICANGMGAQGCHALPSIPGGQDRRRDEPRPRSSGVSVSNGIMPSS